MGLYLLRITSHRDNRVYEIKTVRHTLINYFCDWATSSWKYWNLFTVKPDVLFRATLQTSPATFLIDNLLGPICNRREQLARFSCEVVSFESCVASFLGNSFSNWNFDLEYYPAGEIRVLSCERQREANLFKATTTKFTWDIKQTRKFKPQHIVYKSNFISTADLIAFN